jgi:hypothetical protein
MAKRWVDAGSTVPAVDRASADMLGVGCGRNLSVKRKNEQGPGEQGDFQWGRVGS